MRVGRPLIFCCLLSTLPSTRSSTGQEAELIPPMTSCRFYLVKSLSPLSMCHAELDAFLYADLLGPLLSPQRYFPNSHGQSLKKNADIVFFFIVVVFFFLNLSQRTSDSKVCIPANMLRSFALSGGAENKL